MIDSSNQLSLSGQCKLLSLSRSSIYYQAKGESELNLKLMSLIDAQYL
jgi:putative transposase